MSGSPRQPPQGRRDESSDYRRAARRLRGRLAGRTVAMHHALRALARTEDARRAEPRRLTSGGAGRFLHPPGQCRRVERWSSQEAFAGIGMPGVSPAASEWLAAVVRRELSEDSSNGVLHYSRRQELLRGARRLGIARFDANLIIAAVQHRITEGHKGSGHQSAACEVVQSNAHTSGWSAPWLAGALFVIAAVETLASILLWRALR